MKTKRRLSPNEQIAALKKERIALWQMIYCLGCDNPCEQLAVYSDELTEIAFENAESMGLAGNRFDPKRAKPH
jgi:hypothetical protein